MWDDGLWTATDVETQQTIIAYAAALLKDQRALGVGWNVFFSFFFFFLLLFHFSFTSLPAAVAAAAVAGAEAAAVL